MITILAVVGFLALVQPIAQGILTLVDIATTTDKTVSWRAQGCPVHRLDGSLHYLCKKTAAAKRQ